MVFVSSLSYKRVHHLPRLWKDLSIIRIMWVSEVESSVCALCVEFCGYYISCLVPSVPGLFKWNDFYAAKPTCYKQMSPGAASKRRLSSLACWDQSKDTHLLIFPKNVTIFSECMCCRVTGRDMCLMESYFFNEIHLLSAKRQNLGN